MSGTPTMRVRTSQYQAGSPIGANTKIATIITISRKLVPQRGCRREKRCAFSGVERQARLVAGDRLVLGAVVLEDAAQVAHPREQHAGSRGRSRCARRPRPARTAPTSRAGP